MEKNEESPFSKTSIFQQSHHYQQKYKHGTNLNYNKNKNNNSFNDRRSVFARDHHFLSNKELTSSSRSLAQSRDLDNEPSSSIPSIAQTYSSDSIRSIHTISSSILAPPNVSYSIFHLAGNPAALAQAIFAAAYHNRVSRLKEIFYYCKSSIPSMLHWQECGTGRTAIWYAACHGSNDCLEILLEEWNKLKTVDKLKLNHDRNNESGELEQLGTKKSQDELDKSGVERRQAQIPSPEKDEVVENEDTDDDDDDESDSDESRMDISQYGTSPLLVAAAMNFVDTVSMLLSSNYTSPNITNAHGSTAALLASYHGHDEVLRVLMKHHADFSLANKWEMTPLLAASKGGHINVIEVLVESGVNWNHVDTDGSDCILMATLHNQGKVIDYFSSLASNYQEKEKTDEDSILSFRYMTPQHFRRFYSPSSNNPLHYAVQCNKVESCCALIKSPHVVINAINAQGKNIYHIAIECNSVDVLEQCLCPPLNRFRIDPHFNDFVPDMLNMEEPLSKCTPLFYAIHLSNVFAVLRLAPLVNCNEIVYGAQKKNGTDGLTPLFLAVECNNVEITRALVQLEHQDGSPYIDVNQYNEDGHTPLIRAASLGMVEICEVLITEGGADVNERTKKGGKTALQKAKKRKLDQIVDLLKRLGAE